MTVRGTSFALLFQGTLETKEVCHGQALTRRHSKGAKPDQSSPCPTGRLGRAASSRTGTSLRPSVGRHDVSISSPYTLVCPGAIAPRGGARVACAVGNLVVPEAEAV